MTEKLRESDDPGLFSAEAASEELYSRLAELEAVRRSDLEITRQVSRSGAWYVVHDPVTFRHHRLSVKDYQIFAALQPGRTLDECFQSLIRQNVVDESENEQFYAWVVQLNRLGLVTLPIDTGRVLHSRSVEKTSAGRRAKLAGIMFYRMPLWSPDAFLRRTLRFVAPLFTRVALVIWLIAMYVSCLYVWKHGSELADPFRYASATQSALLMAGLLVVLKGVHEFGHAYACRYFGGRVPEMGMFFIVFTPCAYVDASASWSFTDRRRRIIVALAGMYFESIAAIGALILWSLSGPGLVKAAAHQALMLATIVTIGFNVNPLMKFDGYYILADLLGMPELRNDGIWEWKRYVKRFLYGLQFPSVAQSAKESLGLALFGCSLSAYKVTVIVSISAMIAGLPVIGLPLGLIFFVSFFWQLLGRFVRYSMTSDELAACRFRGIAVAAAGIFGGIGVLFHLPAPGMTTAHGVVRHEFRETLHAQVDGFLESVAAEHGQAVVAGQEICRLSSDALDAEAQRLTEALVDAELEARTLMSEAPAQYQLAIQSLDQVRSRYRQVDRNLAAMTALAPTQGQIFASPVLKVPGSWVRQGEVLAVIGHGRRVVDAVISEEDAIAGLPEPGDRVHVWPEGSEQHSVRGVLLDISPAARKTVSEASLKSIAGGPVEVHSESEESDLAWFSFRVLLEDELDASVCDGVRVVVKLEVERPPIGFSIVRSCCRLRDSFLMSR